MGDEPPGSLSASGASSRARSSVSPPRRPSARRAPYRCSSWLPPPIFCSRSAPTSSQAAPRRRTRCACCARAAPSRRAAEAHADVRVHHVLDVRVPESPHVPVSEAGGRCTSTCRLVGRSALRNSSYARPRIVRRAAGCDALHMRTVARVIASTILHVCTNRSHAPKSPASHNRIWRRSGAALKDVPDAQASRRWPVARRAAGMGRREERRTPSRHVSSLSCVCARVTRSHEILLRAARDEAARPLWLVFQFWSCLCATAASIESITVALASRRCRNTDAGRAADAAQGGTNATAAPPPSRFAAEAMRSLRTSRHRATAR